MKMVIGEFIGAIVLILCILPEGAEVYQVAGYTAMVMAVPIYFAALGKKPCEMYTLGAVYALLAVVVAVTATGKLAWGGGAGLMLLGGTCMLIGAAMYAAKEHKLAVQRAAISGDEDGVERL